MPRKVFSSQAYRHKVVLVSGGCSGIGRALALRFARAGARLAILDLDQAALDSLVQHLRDHLGGEALGLRCDVADADAVERAVALAVERFGGIDVLVNNAGVIALAPVADMRDEDADRLIDINLKGSFNTMREAAKRLRDNGRIINFSSSVVGLLQPGYGMYAASKAAIEALTSVLAKELRGRNITVNAVAPGPTATGLFLDGKTPELIDRLAKMAPLERLGTPEDIAAAVAFLAGADGGWINGQTLRANGGII